MTYGGAGAIVPLLALLVLALPINLFWVFRGSGSFQKRRLIGVSQLAVLGLSIVLFFIRSDQLQSVGLGTAFIVLLSMLLTPVVFKNRL